MNDRSKQQRKALGKGLGALIPGASPTRPMNTPREYFSCPIERLHPQPNQPRQYFDEVALNSLADSIREQGVITPLIVRRRSEGEGYEIIAGERRWRASQRAGIKELPIVVKEANDTEALEMAYVENIQREDLNPLEEAETIKRLIDEHGYTQNELAQRIGRDRSTIANNLRLLSLPEEIRRFVLDGQLTEGHARALLQAANEAKMVTLARMVMQKKLSVRETERRARAESEASGTSKKKPQSGPSSEVKSLVERLQRALGAKVEIVDRKGKGRLEIHYSSYEELDGILNKVLK